jgi:hypothetical protein
MPLLKEKCKIKYHLPFLAGLAVLADSLNALAVGAPAVPGFLIFSPDPAAMRAFFAWMFAYSPGFAIFFSLLTFPTFERGFRAGGVAFGVFDNS